MPECENNFAEICISAAEMERIFLTIMLRHGVLRPKAEICARIFTENTLAGVLSHGVARFPAFVESLRKGAIHADADPELLAAFGAMEQWDGHSGIGITNALHCTDRAIALAEKHGIGCAAMRNNTHWMRPGAYGWHAAQRNFGFICWTNTMANMPAWGSTTPCFGNNPIVIAIPHGDTPIVLDMACSQYSYGAMNLHRHAGISMSYACGYDDDGTLTHDPVVVLKNYRALPIGFWKGSGLSMVLDLMAAVLAGGATTRDIPLTECNLSQIFIAFDVDRFGGAELRSRIVAHVLEQLPNLPVMDGFDRVRYPGQRAFESREAGMKQGMTIPKALWDRVTALAAA